MYVLLLYYTSLYRPLLQTTVWGKMFFFSIIGDSYMVVVVVVVVLKQTIAWVAQRTSASGQNWFYTAVPIACSIQVHTTWIFFL